MTAQMPPGLVAEHWAALRFNLPDYLYFALRFASIWVTKGDRIRLNSTLVSLMRGSAFLVERGGHLSLSSAALRMNAEILVQPGGRVSVGEHFFLGKNATVCCVEEITIGDNVMIAEQSRLYDHDHIFSGTGIPFGRQGLKTAPIRIGNNVWIASNVFIGKGVTIGDNVVIGAGTIVTRDIPSNMVAYSRSELVMRPLD
jgi:acetyltransferase-like isoleucine patch superfamily enzyme